VSDDVSMFLTDESNRILSTSTCFADDVDDIHGFGNGHAVTYFSTCSVL
jgi:hypothetical protein